MHTENLFDLDVRVTTPDQDTQTTQSGRQARNFHLMPTMTTTCSSRTQDDEGTGG